MKTHSIEILENGVVVEEFYDFISGGRSHWYGTPRQLSPEQLRTIREVLAEARFGELPRQLTSRYLDAPGRYIRLRTPDEPHIVTTDDIEALSDAPEELRFRRVWDVVFTVVGASASN